MNAIECNVVFETENEEETTIGHLKLFSVPRVGEYVWFSEKRYGHRSWTVTEVAYHVGSGRHEDSSTCYQTAVLYAKPTGADDE